MRRTGSAALFLAISVFAVRAHADGPLVSAASEPPEPSLPAGLWFRATYERGVLTDAPPPPEFAVTTRPTTSVRALARTLGRVDRSALTVGFPWVASNAWLRPRGRCQEGAVVVAGLFRTAGAAASLRARLPAEFRVVAVDTDSADPCTGAGSDPERELHVVQVDSVTSEAFDPRALERAVERAGGVGPRAHEALAVACRVPRDSVFLFRGGRDFYRFGHGYVPVRCGGRVMFAPKERTRVASVVTHDNRGRTVIHQVTAVSCDMANIDEWLYSRDGRTVISERPPLFEAGCGGAS